MESVGILGFGEVGSALAKFYKDPQIEDDVSRSFKKDVEILHVCIPYSRDFVKIVKNKIKQTFAKLTIIHSTIPIGTTRKIGGAVVHSPVRGVHPRLFRGLKTFVKYIGYDDKNAALRAERHFQKLGIKTRIVADSRNTEALKLWDTTQYGLMIILNKEIKRFCDELGLNFNIIYTEANKTYNSGYIKLGRAEVVRPFLKHMSGDIGGHCVINNCKLLNENISRFILSKKYSKKNL